MKLHYLMRQKLCASEFISTQNPWHRIADKVYVDNIGLLQ